ncbi:MAG: PhnD/SsuA/transferrin family substrate-binding protein [Yoonia sp.]
MIASLPMYDRPANVAAHDTLWAHIRDNLRDAGVAAPASLDRVTHYEAGWARPDLVLGQICNLPLRAMFSGKVALIGAADYGLDGCPAGHYNSLFVVRKDAVGKTPKDFANARFVANSLMSHSGYGAAQAWARLHGFTFVPPMITDAHDNSLLAVVNGAADIACIDAQTWWMQKQDMVETTQVRVIGWTDPSPGQTFIARLGEDTAIYFAAIEAAIADLPTNVTATLGLRGIVKLPEVDYDLPLPPLPAAIGA